MKIINQQLKAFIEDSNLVTEDVLLRVYREAEKKNEDLAILLLKKKLLTEEQVAQLRAYISGIPYVSLKKVKIAPDVLKIIPEPLARKNNIIAYKKEDNNLEVAMLDPHDLQTIDFIRKNTGLKIRPRLTSPKDIQEALSQYEESLQKEFESLVAKDEGASEIKIEGKKIAGRIIAELKKRPAVGLVMAAVMVGDYQPSLAFLSFGKLNLYLYHA